MSAMTCPHGGSAVAFRPPLTPRSRSFRILIGVLLAVGLLIMVSGWESLMAAKRKYEVVDFRVKTPVGNWPGIKSDERHHIRRTESATGLALEIMFGPEDGQGTVKILDSVGNSLWKGAIGDGTRLAKNVPAFVSYSSTMPYLRIFNLDVGSTPVYEDPRLRVMRVFESPDGTTFGILGTEEIRLLSGHGDILGIIKLPESRGNIVSAAMSVGGEYAAVGWSAERAGDDVRKPRPPRAMPRSDRHSAAAPAEGAAPGETLPTSNQDSAAADGFTPRELKPDVSSRGESSRYSVSIFDQTGAKIGDVFTPPNWGAPQRIALSGDSPPNVAVADSKGVSVWRSDGTMIWEDSIAFLGHKRALSKALRILRDGSVCAVTTRSAEHATFWAWRSDGTRETELRLPENFNALRRGAQFFGATDTSIRIQTDHEVVTVRWQAQ